MCTLLLVFCVSERRSRASEKVYQSWRFLTHPPQADPVTDLRLMRVSLTADKVIVSSLRLGVFGSQGACTYNPNDFGVVFPLTI